jgi:hypothetical protein
MNTMKLLAALLLLIPPLTACDALKDRMGIPIPEKVEAEGKAIGSACRHAGRGLEDCFRLNPQADKAAVHTGWKEMNEYMLKNNMQSIPPEFPASPPGKAAKHKAEDEADTAHEDSAATAKDDKAAEAKDGHAAAKDGHPADKETAGAKKEKPESGKSETKPEAKAEEKKKPDAKSAH